MRNRESHNLVFVLVVSVAAAGAFWLMHAPSPPKQSTTFPEASSARMGPADIYPDTVRTPGAPNPDITQDNIRKTICNPRWSTKSVRPPASYTHRLKVEQIREYEYRDSSLKDYEEDHFIPLELGGNPTDPKNLWPEPFETSIHDGGAREKNQVEVYLHAEVCSGSLTLQQAQKEIIDDWYRVYTTSVPH